MGYGKKAISLMLVVLAFCLLLASCDAGQIEDTNGDEITLCTLTEEEIFAKYNSHVSVGLVNRQLKNEYRFKAKRFSGVYKVGKFKAQGKTLTIKSDAELDAGNLRIVVLCDGEYLADIPVEKGQTLIFDHPKGEYEVRLAGESAKIDFSFTYSLEN